MASFNINGFDALLKPLDDLEAMVKKNGPAAALAGAQVAAEKLRKNTPKRTGDLAKAITIKGPFHNIKDGHHYEIVFKGADKRGQRYGMIAAITEYGRSNMSPRPFVRETLQDPDGDIGKAMVDALYKEAGK